MRIADEIRLEAADLAIGDRKRCQCVVCGRDTLSLKRVETGVLYNCFRASCPTTGFVPSIGSELVKSKRKHNKPKSKPYTRETVNLPKHVIKFMMVRFGLDFETLHDEGWKWNDETQRVIMPIRNARRAELGHNARYWGELDAVGLGAVGPKSITYWNQFDCVKYHMPLRCNRGGTLTLVEDQPSAVRLAQDTDTVALLGTHAEPAVMEELCRMNYSRIVLALDADATLKAIKIRKQYSLFFNRFDVVPLSGPDIKDMTADEYNTFLEVAYGKTLA